MTRKRVALARGGLLLLLGLSISACYWLDKRGEPATIRAYTGTTEDVIVRVTALGTSLDWSLPANDVVELVFVSDAMPSDVRVEFLDASTCEVLAAASSIPRNARIGLDFIDPAYAVTVTVDQPGTAPTISLRPASQCSTP